MQAKHTLEVQRRERTGSRYARRARAAGRLPCVIYGHGQAPLHVETDHKLAIRYFESGERVFQLALQGDSQAETVLLKDLQFDYLGTNVVHCDLVRVNLDEVVESNVHLRFVGDAKGLKTAGAIFTNAVTELHVACKVRNLPDEIRVDISDLEAEHALLARDIALPEGVELKTEGDVVIAQITISKVKEEETAEAAEGEDEAGQPEVITAKKEEEGAGAEGDKKD